MDAYSYFLQLSSYVIRYEFLGYIVIFSASFLETIPFSGLFIPSNTIMLIAGVLAYEQYLDAWGIIGLAILGGALGDMFGYWLGKKYNLSFSNPALRAKKSYFEKTEAFFNRHGKKSVLLGRFVSPVRPFIAFIAGACKMHFPIFMFWNIIGSILWATIFFSLGYIFGGSIEKILSWVDKVEYVIIALVVAIGPFLLARRFMQKRAKNTDEIV